MSDLVERLRALSRYEHSDFSVGNEAADTIESLQAKLEVAKGLLVAANCPECDDKSGAYYDNVGNVCQCQWCYEALQLIGESKDE